MVPVFVKGHSLIHEVFFNRLFSGFLNNLKYGRGGKKTCVFTRLIEVDSVESAHKTFRPC